MTHHTASKRKTRTPRQQKMRAPQNGLTNTTHHAFSVANDALRYCRSAIDAFADESVRRQFFEIVKTASSPAGAWALARKGAEMLKGAGARFARRSVPALIDALKSGHDYIAGAAALVLYEVGPAAVPALIEALRDSHERMRRNAGLVLGNIGAAAKDAVPALIEELKDASPAVRKVAAWALGRIGVAKGSVNYALSSLVNDSDEKVRAAAARAMGRLSEKALYSSAPFTQQSRTRTAKSKKRRRRRGPKAR